MIVYCDAKSCRHNIDCICRKEFAVGTEGIILHETDTGYIVCQNYQKQEDE